MDLGDDGSHEGDEPGDLYHVSKMRPLDQKPKVH